MVQCDFQCLLGIQGDGFVMVASDQTNSQGVIVLKNDEDKLFQISSHILMGLNGEPGDMCQFSQFVAKNVQLYKMKNKYSLSTEAVVHFSRKNMVEMLKIGTPFVLNILVAGFEEGLGPQLYSVDYLGTAIKVPFAAHGIGRLFSYSIMDSLHRPSMKEEDAYEVIMTCVHEIQQRLLINLRNFQVKMVSKDGISTLPVISPASLAMCRNNN